MIDSTNPRIMANAIRKLFSKTSAIPVVKGNPTGSGFNTLLTKLQIGSSKYKLPEEVTANPTTESTTLLSALKIGSDEFILPENVIANPEGEATVQITKIQIGDTIYQFTAISNNS